MELLCLDTFGGDGELVRCFLVVCLLLIVHQVSGKSHWAIGECISRRDDLRFAIASASLASWLRYLLIRSFCFFFALFNRAQELFLLIVSGVTAVHS